MIGGHCMSPSHESNNPNIFLYAKHCEEIKDFFQSLCVYFFHSPKETQVFIELANIVETHGQHILRNIKIGWISMLLLIKRVLGFKHDKVCQKSSPKKI